MISPNITLVNARDEVIGNTDVLSTHRGDGKRHRAVSVFLFNKRGEVLLQQRSKKKIVGAMQWANTCCGNVHVGETREECAYRRLREELGITNISLSPLYTFEYHVRCNRQFSEWEIDQIFVGEYEGNVDLNSNEVHATEWKDTDAVQEAVKNLPASYAPWLSIMLRDARLSAQFMKRKKRDITTSASGKIIVSGEHSVVYGYPAIAVPVPMRTTVTLSEGKEKEQQNKQFLEVIRIISDAFSMRDTNVSFEISSSVPQNSGLGSSAALAFSIAQAIAQYTDHHYSKEEFFSVVQACEKIFHGQPSGVDAATVVFEDCVRFQKSKTGEMNIQKLDSLRPIPKFMLIDSGKAIESTKDMIDIVSSNLSKDRILRQIGRITSNIELQLKRGEFDLTLITQNERLLEKLGVVGEMAAKIIRDVESIGGHAKIAGAGGVKSGSGMILAFHDDMDRLKAFCDAKQYAVVTT